MLVGVWLTGGLFMMITATASGGGFAGANGVRDSFFVLLLSVIPIYTFIAATYDGSLFALLAVTVGILLIGSIGSSGMPLPHLRRPR